MTLRTGAARTAFAVLALAAGMAAAASPASADIPLTPVTATSADNGSSSGSTTGSNNAGYLLAPLGPIFSSISAAAGYQQCMVGIGASPVCPGHPPDAH